ncbi:hypothetical protein RQP46_008716 [Phenoliferia psychrophenolica]
MVQDSFGGENRGHDDVANGIGGPVELELELVRRLGGGTYAMLILGWGTLSPIDAATASDFSMSSTSTLHLVGGDPLLPITTPPTYGCNFALKRPCKLDLTDELVEIQRVSRSPAARKIAELNTELAPADPTGETRLRNVYDWSVGHAGIAFDVLSLIPRTAPFSPLVKLIIGVALLSAGAGEATDACRKLMNRLISIHLESLPLRKPGKDSRIDQEMDIILAEFHEFILPHFEKSVCSVFDLVLGKVNDWTSRINVLQQDYVGDRMEAKVEALQQLNSIDLIGRERDLNLIFDHLSQKEEHLSLVGVGGIGKTALAIKVAHHPRAKDFGRPVFIPCERLGTLDLFQATLLRLRAPNRLKQSEDLEQAVRHELEKESLLLILDNLLDTSDASHASYFDYIKTLTTITKLTILITSRNHSFKNIFTSRAIHPYVLDALSPLKSKQLFLRHYRTDEINLNDQDRIDLKKLLDLLSGLPLAIRIVAVYARGHGAGPLANVIVLWKQGVAWDTGLETRDTSVDLSLRMSFSDVLIKAPGTLGLLRLLAGLPQPILARRGSPPGPISKAITAIVERSVGQRDIIEGESYLRILGPVREYILRHHPELDFANDATTTISFR